MNDDRYAPRAPLALAGIVLGVGMGGFVDGILLHQLLQWHNMLSSKRPPTDLVSMKYNMVWDGLFHAFTWLTTAVGIFLLWRAGTRGDVDRSGGTLMASLCVGWGVFNFVEGLVDHELLAIHHVHPGRAELAWELGFLALGLLQIAAGAVLLRRAPGGGELPRRGESP